MIIGVSGFSWSGSGAVIDYLMEFEENQIYNTEFILAYHPDGLRDLDVNLNENCAKFMSSGVALPRFKKIANYLLDHETDRKARQLTQAYIDQLTQAKWVGSIGGQVCFMNMWLYRHAGSRIMAHLMGKLSQDFCWKYKPYPMGERLFSIQPERFLETTQDYVDALLALLGLDIHRNIVLNQPFPGNNPIPYMKYFRDSKAIVVDRDPRDVFVFLKYLFPGRGYSVPLQDVNMFCAYFDNMHKNLPTALDHPDVLYLHFEDLVYHDKETTDRIRRFLNLGEPTHSRQYFIPEASEANTQVFVNHGNTNEIRVIEQKLRNYLYDFSKVERRERRGVMFDDNPRSKGYTFKTNR